MCKKKILVDYQKGSGSQWVWEKYNKKYKMLKMSGDIDLILGP